MKSVRKLGSFGQVDAERFSTCSPTREARTLGWFRKIGGGLGGVRARNCKMPQVVTQSSDRPENWVRSVEPMGAFFAMFWAFCLVPTLGVGTRETSSRIESHTPRNVDRLSMSLAQGM